MRFLGFLALLACDPLPVTPREQVAVLVHLDDLAELAHAIEKCGTDSGASVWLYTTSDEVNGLQAFGLQVDAEASVAFTTCLGKALEELGS